MILLIDNYDSFAYNIYQLIGSFRKDILVKMNDQITLDEIIVLKPEKLSFLLAQKTGKCRYFNGGD